MNRHVLALLTAATLATVHPVDAFGQAAGSSLSGGAAQDVAPLPITPAQIDRVQRALGRDSGVLLDERQLRFYLEIIARQPTFAEYSRGYDFLNGPTKRGNPMTHQEFVDIVTPKVLYSSGLVPAIDRLQVAFTNWMGQSLIKKALEDLKGARTSSEVQEIRERIDRELEALTGAGKGKPQTPRSTAE